jgi:hypothetical protein
MSMDVEMDPTAEQLLEHDRLRAAKRTRAAMTVVAIIFLGIVSCCIYRIVALMSSYAFVAIVVMAVTGIVLIAIEPKSDSQELNELRILRFYRSKRFYGIVVTITSAVVMIFALLTAQPAHAKARSLPSLPPPEPAQALAEPVRPAEMAPPEFPYLKVTGMILNGTNSSALINGRTIRLGDYIEDVKLVDIHEDYIEVQLKGFQRFVPRADLIAPVEASPSASHLPSPRH